MNKRIISKTDQKSGKAINIEVSPIVMGCMRIINLSEKEAADFIQNAVEHDVNCFDHADIYGAGECETLFGKAFKQTGIKREDVFIQTKCGIVPGKMYDLSKKHIIESVNESLKRLNTDYVDALLLHRPDALVEPEEVATAFDQLAAQGKVKYFGVSNHNSMQLALLQKYVNQPLIFNQLQMSAVHTPMITSGLEVNMMTDGAINRDGSVLDYCRLNNITIQAWSPFQHGFISGPFLTNPKFNKLNTLLADIGKKYNATATTIAAAWLLRHPCNMQVISGSMNQNRFNEICKACDIKLTREEWYEIYMSAGNMLP